MLVITLSAFLQSVHGQSLNLIAKIQNTQTANCSVTVYQNGKILSHAIDVKRRYKLDLSFNSKYEIWFEAEGHAAKVVVVSTENVPEYMKHEVLDFAFEIDLHESHSEYVINDKKPIVARWFFHTDLGEFDYHTGEHVAEGQLTSTDKSL